MEPRMLPLNLCGSLRERDARLAVLKETQAFDVLISLGAKVDVL